MSDISVRNLSFGYDENLVFDGINLEYDCKDFLAIIGPNGGGKSTLLKLLLGLNKPSGGTIEVFGQEPASVFSRYPTSFYSSSHSFFIPI